MIILKNSKKTTEAAYGCWALLGLGMILLHQTIVPHHKVEKDDLRSPYFSQNLFFHHHQVHKQHSTYVH